MEYNIIIIIIIIIIITITITIIIIKSNQSFFAADYSDFLQFRVTKQMPPERVCI
jgi:hypothetical protein